MRIDRQWYECEDRNVRPIILGNVLDANGEWRQVMFLVDTGADCTVICSADLRRLGFDTNTGGGRLGGIGGGVNSVYIQTHTQLARDDGVIATFRGQFLA
jgi:hypothetical protein